MLTRYPDSQEVLNTYCRMGYFAEDRKQAKELFVKIGDSPTTQKCSASSLLVDTKI